MKTFVQIFGCLLLWAVSVVALVLAGFMLGTHPHDIELAETWLISAFSLVLLGAAGTLSFPFLVLKLWRGISEVRRKIAITVMVLILAIPSNAGILLAKHGILWWLFAFVSLNGNVWCLYSMWRLWLSSFGLERTGWAILSFELHTFRFKVLRPICLLGRYLLANAFPVIAFTAMAVMAWLIVPTTWPDVQEFWRYYEPAETRLQNANRKLNELEAAHGESRRPIGYQEALKMVEIGSQKLTAANELYQNKGSETDSKEAGQGLRLMAQGVQILAEHLNIQLDAIPIYPPPPPEPAPSPGLKKRDNDKI